MYYSQKEWLTESRLNVNRFKDQQNEWIKQVTKLIKKGSRRRSANVAKSKYTHTEILKEYNSRVVKTK